MSDFGVFEESTSFQMTPTTVVHDFNETADLGIGNATLNGTRRHFFQRRIDPLQLGLLTYKYYGYPVILAFGSIGNILAYLICTRTRLKKVSSVHYLAAVAVTDTGFLWTSFLTPLYLYYGIPIIVQVGVCQFMTFLNYVFTFLSIWYLVAMIVEKFIGIYWPLKKTTMCTPFRAKIVMVFMAILSVACYSYVVYFFGPVGKTITWCHPWPELKTHFENLNKIDSVVVGILPYAIIILLTTLILIRGCEYYRISAAVELWPRQDSARSDSTQCAMSDTQLVFPVLMLTLISNLPMNLIRSAMSLNGIRMRSSLKMWNNFFYEFYILNFAIKFLVYLIFSVNFRCRTWNFLRTTGEKLRQRCERESSSSSELQDINMEAITREQNARACLMTRQSDI